jgi:hypothetical protein
MCQYLASIDEAKVNVLIVLFAACLGGVLLCCRRVLPGLVLKGLAAVLPTHLLTSNSSSGSSGVGVDVHLLQELRQCAADDLAAAVAGPVFQSGKQDIPVDLTSAPPLYFPTERVRQQGWWVLWVLAGGGQGGRDLEQWTSHLHHPSTLPQSG